MTDRSRGKVEQVVLDAIEAHAEEAARPGVWLSRYLDGYHTGDGASLSKRIDRLYRERHPEARNRPSHRQIEAALANLIAEGLVEMKKGEHDALYRKAVA
jgi:hypothetical protein